MAIAYSSDIAGEVAQNVAEGTDTVSLGSLAANTYVIICMAVDGYVNTNYTMGENAVAAGWTIIADGTGDAAHHVLLSKQMGGTPDTTITIEESSYNIMNVAGQAFTGVDTGTPLDVAITKATGGGGDPDSPSITPDNPNCMILTIGVGDDDNATGIVTTPSGFSNELMNATDTGLDNNTDTSLCFASLLQGAAAAIDPDAWDLDDFNDAWTAYTVALRESTGGGSSIPIFQNYYRQRRA